MRRNKMGKIIRKIKGKMRSDIKIEGSGEIKM